MSNNDRYGANAERNSHEDHEEQHHDRQGTGRVVLTGDVYVDTIADPYRLAAANVHFTPGARTAWHTRGGPEPEAITLDAFGREIPEA